VKECADLPSDEERIHGKERTVPRYAFVAMAEIVESSSETRILGRTTDISRNGCYVDTMNPLSVGSKLHLVISQNQGSFATQGRVLYVHPAIGMGVEFVDTAEDQLVILDSWLAQLSGTQD
jgi:hypothetical protein